MYSFEIPNSLSLGKINPQETNQLYVIEGINNYLFKYLDYSASNKLSTMNTLFLADKENIICLVFNLSNPLGKPLFISKKLNNFSFDIHQFVKDLPTICNDLYFQPGKWKLLPWFYTMMEKLPSVPFKSLIENSVA